MLQSCGKTSLKSRYFGIVVQLSEPRHCRIEHKVFVDIAAIVYFPVWKWKERLSKKLEPADYKETKQQRNKINIFLFLFKQNSTGHIVSGQLFKLKEHRFLVPGHASNQWLLN